MKEMNEVRTYNTLTEAEKERLVSHIVESVKEEELLKEFYDGFSMGTYTVAVQVEDRNEYTPHIHVYDGKDPRRSDTVSLEVSLPDYRVINVKNPRNGVRDWSAYGKVAKQFKSWLPENEEMILRTFIEKNPSNKHLDMIKQYYNEKYGQLPSEDGEQKPL